MEAFCFLQLLCLAPCWPWLCPACCRNLTQREVIPPIIWRSKLSSYFDLEPGKRANPRVALFLAICVRWADGLLHSKPAVTALRGSCSVLRHNSWCYLDLAVKSTGSVSLSLTLTGWVWLLTSHQGMMEARKTIQLLPFQQKGKAAQRGALQYLGKAMTEL